MKPTNDSLLHSFYETARKIAALNLEVGPSGNLSFRESDDQFVITPTGTSFAEVDLDRLAIYSAATEKYTGAKPSSDTTAHVAIYKNRPDVQAIVHTHTHYSVVLAMLGQDIPVHSTMQADYVGGSIKCVPFANHRREGYGKAEHFARGSYFLLEKHGGALLFDHQDSAKIANSVQAFAEIARLHYEYLVSSTLLGIERHTLSEDEIGLINNYYATQYGDKGDKKVSNL